MTKRNSKRKKTKNAKWKHLRTKLDAADEWKLIQKKYYGKNTWVSVNDGMIDFSPNGMKKVKGGEQLTYPDYLKIQYSSLGHTKVGLERVFFDAYSARFKGEITKKIHDHLLFKKLYIDAIDSDLVGYVDSEDHVWMSAKPFNDLKINDCVEFDAKVYRYLKVGHGKRIDYGLVNPKNIKRITPYSLPSSEQIKRQIVDDLLWSTSKYNGIVDRTNWPNVRNEDEYRHKFKILMSMMLADNN